MKPDTITLSEKDLEHLRCSVCDAYLSIPPIKSSVDGKQYQCGRCDMDNPKISVRNFSYEKIAKFLKFPCIYCREKIAWENVKNHELGCTQRSIICPYCDAELKSYIVIAHFNMAHNDALIYNVSRIDFTLGNVRKIKLKLLVHNGSSFFCFFTLDKEFFKVSVYSLQNKSPKEYQLILIDDSVRSGRKIILPEEQIVQYNYREHCVKCYVGRCYSKLHKYSSHYSKKYEMTTNLETASIKSVLNSDSINCQIILNQNEVTKNKKFSWKYLLCILICFGIVNVLYSSNDRACIEQAFECIDKNPTEYFQPPFNKLYISSVLITLAILFLSWL